MKSIIILIVGIMTSGLSMAHSGHLSYKQNTLHIHASFQKPPVVNQEAIIILEAKQASSHQAIHLDDEVEVALWMPDMGHGSAPTQVERAMDSQGHMIPGVFLVRNVYFIMGGNWEVQVTLTDSQGVRETKSFRISLAGSGHGGHHEGGH